MNPISCKGVEVSSNVRAVATCKDSMRAGILVAGFIVFHAAATQVSQ